MLTLSQAAERRFFEQATLDAGKAELGNLHCILERFCACSLQAAERRFTEQAALETDELLEMQRSLADRRRQLDSIVSARACVFVCVCACVCE